MQSPAAADEDTRGDFQLGGWAAENNDQIMAEEMAKGMTRHGALLFGRRTYEHFMSVWPKRKDNPFTDVLNQTHKYVASRTLKEPHEWQSSTLLPGDAAKPWRA